MSVVGQRWGHDIVFELLLVSLQKDSIRDFSSPIYDVTKDFWFSFPLPVLSWIYKVYFSGNKIPFFFSSKQLQQLLEVSAGLWGFAGSLTLQWAWKFPSLYICIKYTHSISSEMMLLGTLMLQWQHLSESDTAVSVNSVMANLSLTGNTACPLRSLGKWTFCWFHLEFSLWGICGSDIFCWKPLHFFPFT